MKIAILSVTEKGLLLSEKLKSSLDSDPTIIKTDIFHKDIKKTLKNIFHEYDGIIGIMATGILIRNICEKIKTKYDDPAILSIDDNGKFVISLLSGHIGGANRLTHKIANILNSIEVITTATDINGKIGIDVLANHFFCDIKDNKNILVFNKAILENKIISLESNFKLISSLKTFLEKNTLEMDDVKKDELVTNIIDDDIFIDNNNIFNKEINSYCLNIKTNKNNDKINETNKNNIIANFEDKKLILYPKKLVVGIGSRKDIDADIVLIAIKKATNNLNLSLNRIDCLVTGNIKKNEKGILEVSNLLDIPLKFIGLEKIKNFYNDDELSKDCLKSDFVKKNFGVYGICEPSALIEAGNGSHLIHKKISYKGVTIAIAISNGN